MKYEKKQHWILFLSVMIGIVACSPKSELSVEIYETSASGNKLSIVEPTKKADKTVKVTLKPEETFQQITGFGGSFTESTAYLLMKLSKANRDLVIEAYFGETGAKYSLTRTHIGSSDFSLGNYSYAPVKNDMTLKNFSIKEDMDDLIPIIKQAQAVSKDGFKLIASPWTAPPWMKNNNSWKGGKLLPKYYEVWSLYFSKYIKAYAEQGIPIWGITVENEPLGNDSNWESMHFNPHEMNNLVKNHLGPMMRKNHPEVKILGYDQNRDTEMIEWVDAMYKEDEKVASFYDGVAVHWYGSTYDVFPDQLQYAYKAAPGKHIIQSEACVDGQIPAWKDDAWYWAKEAKDWGWTWAPEDKKYLHPTYVPVFRYARDIIGTLNNWVDGWVDWNMVLDRQGGPNWAKNWCTAPVIVDPDADEVYVTPLYYTLAHFSRFIRPGATRIGIQTEETDLLITAAQHKDGSIAVVVLNQADESRTFELELVGKTIQITISGKAIQTVIIPEQTNREAI